MRIEEHDGAQSRAAVAPLAAAVYPPDVLATIVWRHVKSAPAARRALVFDDAGDVVAIAGWLFRQGRLDGTPVRIGGVGGVMTAPGVRRRGFGRAAMLAAHDAFVRDPLVDFCLLFCEPKTVAFYEGLGWRVFHGSVVADQPAGSGVYDIMTTMVRQARSPAPMAGAIDLCGLPW